MKPLYLFLLLLLWCSGAVGQNLVRNGSFEEYVSCPNGPGQFWRCNDWDFYFGSPDFYHQCGSVMGIPSNVAGFQDAFGQAYAGFFGYYSGHSESEILFGSLSEPLLAGMEYRIRLKASYADSLNYAICCVDVILSSSAPPLLLTPKISQMWNW